MSEMLNPKDYGAVGNGSTDDTRAVLDTIDALPPAGGVIAFPPGHFMLGDLDDTSGKSYTVRGAGSGRTGIGTIPLAGVTSLTAVDPGVACVWGINNSASHYGQRILFQNIGFNGYPTTDGIRCAENPPTISFEEVSFRELASGLKGKMLLRASHTSWDDCVIGVEIETQESFESSFVGCRFNKNTTAHIQMSGAYNLLATGCYFYGDSNSSRGIDCDTTPGRIQLVGNFFDGIRNQHVRVLGGFFVIISDNIMENGGLDSAGAPSILIGPAGVADTQQFVIANNIISHKNGSVIRVSGSGPSSQLDGTIANNWIGLDVTGVTSAGHGIEMPDCGGVVVVGNTINGGSGTGRGTPTMMRGIACGHGAIPHIVQNNRIFNLTADPVLASQVPVILDGNSHGDARTRSLDVGGNHDYIPDAARTLRLSGAGGGSVLTGIDHGTAGRRIRIVNVSGNSIVVTHEDTRSKAVNRILHPAASHLTLAEDEIMDLEYDGVSSRWRVVNVLSSRVITRVESTLC